MKKAKKFNEVSPALIPVKSEIQNLLTMFDFFLTQRQLRKPIEVLNESIRDMRLIIGRLLMDHFLNLDYDDGDKFCEALAEMLADCCESIPDRELEDDDYFKYCVSEVLTCFEYAVEIKREFEDDPVLQKMLALDIPILRPFDYGLRGGFKLVKTEKKKKIHL